MSVNMYGLKRKTFYQLLHFFQSYADIIEKIILFGSRARGDYKETSDIDIAIKFRKNNEQLYRIQDDLAEVNIIYTVDVIDYDKISNGKLKSYIDQEGKTIFLTNDRGEIVVTMNKIIDKLSDFEKALYKLHQSVGRDVTKDDLVLDATIQRFEFTYDLAWKWMKSYLEYNGNNEVTSPRKTIKEAFKEGLIQDGETWIQMLEDRNRTSHTYDEQIAMEIYEHIRQRYVYLFDRLLMEMKKRVEELEK
ncbi:nucleotidyltransferase substrate binding protein (TIGR01987 family) [Anoxybacillus rupiensis]|nr:nucleotidyltransferase substrate binding protein (TIGR01987 family) [Anoxybacillus rupiensis]